MAMTCAPSAVCDGSQCLQLTEREAEVCMTICNSPEPVTFSSLKKRVGYHQEIVSRILRRLMNHGAIKKVEGRYQPVCASQ